MCPCNDVGVMVAVGALKSGDFAVKTPSEILQIIKDRAQARYTTNGHVHGRR